MARNPTATQGSEASPPDWLDRQHELRDEFDRLYERFVRPLEQEHWGEYAVVAPDGRMVINPDEFEAVQEAVATLGRGNFLFKIGEIDIGTFR